MKILVDETSGDDAKSNYTSPPSPTDKKHKINLQVGAHRKLSIINERPEIEDQEEERKITPSKQNSGTKKRGKSSEKCDDLFKDLEKQGPIDDLYDPNCVLKEY